VAVHVTVVKPSAKVLPEAGVHTGTTAAPSTESVAVGIVYVTTAPAAEVASTQSMLAGTPTRDGAVPSHTSTLNDVEKELPTASTEEQVTVELPMAKVLPEAGTQVTSREPPTESVAVGLV